MDLNRLRYFSVVAETGQISRAAALLHITPTALSKAVKVLERELGVPLLQPKGRGIVLTDEGRQLALRSAPLLADLASLTAQITARRSAGPRLRYASHEVFGTYFTRPLLAAMPEGSAIEHRYVVPGEIEAAVLSGQSDVGITYIPIPTSGLEHTPVRDLRVGIFGLPSMLDVPVDQLEYAAPLRPTIGSPIRAQSLDAWPDDRVPRIVRHRITTTEAALELCRQGSAVAVFPQFVVTLHNRTAAADQQLVEIPGPAALTMQPQTTYVVTRSADPHPIGRAWIESALAAVVSP